MSDNGSSQVSSLVSGLNSSIQAAVQRLQSQASETSSSSSVKEFQKTVSKSSSNASFHATDIGILARATTRLNVVSNLAANDTVDFMKFRVTTKGEATMGFVGDEGVRIQLMSKLGAVVADTDKESGASYDNYLKLSAGELTLDRGDYTVRLTRDKGQDPTEAKNYALQFQMGGYTQDFDTVAKQPSKSDNPWQISEAQQSMLSGLTSALSNLQSIPTGQSGTQKLMGSFSLFV